MRPPVLIAIPCLLRGGTEQQTLQLARVIRGCADQVSICCYFESDQSIVAEFERSGVTVQKLGLDRRMSSWRILMTLRTAFSAQPCALVHIQYMAPGFLPVLGARLARVPKVLATVHQPATPYGRKAKWLLRTAALMCDRFICVSEAAERSWFGSSGLYAPMDNPDPMRRLTPSHCTIHNAIDVDRVDAVIARSNAEQLRARHGWQGKFVIGAVSRLRYEKGIDLLVSAFGLLARQVASARLLVVGGGPDTEKLKTQARALGVEALVYWAGEQPWERAIELMSAMDVVVVPSRYEGFGLTAAEAMACRKPVIASNIDGLAEVIGAAGAGVLVPENTPAALAKALLQSWHCPANLNAMANAGRHRVEDAFSFPLYTARILRLYQSLFRAQDPEPSLPSALHSRALS